MSGYKPDYNSLADMQADMATCRKCLEAGYQIESMPLFVGHKGMPVLLIGQAPSEHATQPGHTPFSKGTGASRLFDWMLRAGWREEEFRDICYFSAVTKCFPGKNPKGDGDRVPSKEEQALCRGWLDGELYFVKPKLILTVGGLAASIFFAKGTKLTDIIGTWIEDGDGRRILPLPHPSGASRWLNRPQNLRRLDTAIRELRILKHDLGL